MSAHINAVKLSPMKTIFAKQALTPSGWAEDISLTVDQAGQISDCVQGVRNPEPHDHNVEILLPAPVNAHSHAFQRAMAGLTEGRSPNPADSFWTWRQLMFRFLDQLNPDHVQAIAALVQMEMLEAGYATNVEFHYLHHQPDGSSYDAIAEMATRIAAAAELTGIGLTLLPVHYQYGGCDQRELAVGQQRFGNSLDAYFHLFEASADALRTLPPDTRLGVAPHSLRAVGQNDLNQLAALAGARPFHIHLAEQQAEVEEVQAHWGSRPVEYLLANADIKTNWCLIHCTQMLPHETEGLAATGAVAGLCPITESSLGDGIFDGVRWFDSGGKIAIGSDSNIRISLSEELRTLEYSQRLRDHSRAALASREKSTGRRLYDAALEGGALSANRPSGEIAVGKLADLVALDGQCLDLLGRKGDMILDSFVFARGEWMITHVWSAGRHVVQDGRHVKRNEIERSYARALAELEVAI